MGIKDKMIALIPKKQNVADIKVPDLKQYLVDGYNEIRQVKSEKIKLENELEEQKKNEQLYKGALVTLDEFKKRDDENKEIIENLKRKISKKDNEIYELQDKINSYNIIEKELKDKQMKLEQQKKRTNEEIEEKAKLKVANYKKKIRFEINNIKGHCTKEKILEIL